MVQAQYFFGTLELNIIQPLKNKKSSLGPSYKKGHWLAITPQWIGSFNDFQPLSMNLNGSQS